MACARPRISSVWARLRLPRRVGWRADMRLDQMYQEIILDHYRNPHGSGLQEPYDAESFQINPTCGDEIKLRVKLDGETVTAVSHETLGCSISQASASVLTDLVVGRSVGESMKILQAFQEM